MAKVESLEQLIMRDNSLGNTAAEALYYLVKQKRNLWKLPLDMNMIKYGTLLDIEKECKKNKRYAALMTNSLPHIKQEISRLE